MSTEVSIYIPRPKKRVSESRRQQNVYRYFVPHLTGIDLSSELDAPNTRLPPLHHVPKPSPDAGLTAFAQLGAIRLGASRGLISLIDGKKQFILAEATQTLSLREGSKESGKNRLWLGNVSIPKSKGLCQLILSHGYDGQRLSRTAGEDYDEAVIIDDLSQHDEYASEWFIHEGPHVRFYAGVPLLCPDGSAIGAFCIFDDTPRKGLGQDELVIMQDLAATVMQHLTTYKFERDLRRGERMVRGLTSFIEGAKSLQPAYSPGDSEPSTPPLSPSSPMKSIDKSSQDREPSTDAQETVKAILAPPREMAGATSAQSESEVLSEKSSPKPNGYTGPPTVKEGRIQTIDHAGKSPSPEPRNQSSNPRDSLLPIGAKLMFSRAANIIRETSALDGVLMFDASVAANKTRTSSSRKAPPALERESSGQTDESESSGVGSPYPRSGMYSQSQSSHDGFSDLKRRGRKMCHMLCFSDGFKSSVSGDSADTSSSYRTLPEADLKRMLDQYPDGRVINFDATGNVSSTEDDYIRPKNATSSIKIPRVVPRKSRKRSIAEAIQAIVPGARSVAILPVWDYDRQRWFSVGIFFTMDPRRILSPELDLIYFKAFANTMMTELSRLDAINSNNTKTTFVASISHELRSPLHGILGGVEFMQGSSMTAFQASMLNSIEMCGTTLLDVVDHILDFSKLSEMTTKSRTRPSTKMRMKGSRRVLVSPLRPRRQDDVSNSLTSTIDLALCAEEVVESVFAGKSYRVMSNRVDEQPKMAWPGKRKSGSGQNLSKPQGDADRKPIVILLDIPNRENWRFQTQPGAWRRILMNIFGNALKYTESGFIRVALAAHNNDNSFGQASLEADDSTGSLSSLEGKYSADTRVTLTVSDSGIGMSEEYLANRIYTPFSQENSFFAGTGLGLSIVRQLVESLGGSIDVRSQRRLGTEVRVDINLPSSGFTPISESFDLNPITALAARIQGKRVCVLEKPPISKSTSDPSSSSKPTTASPTLGPSLVKILKDWFSVEVSLCSQWDDTDFDIVILTEVSFDYLKAIRERRDRDTGRVPIVIFVALDAIEASSLRNDLRVTDEESAVEIITQPCGPHKLAKALNHCLDRYESVFENKPQIENLPLMPNRSASPKSSPSPTAEQIDRMKDQPYILIVDDNNINRRLLVAFMNKHEYAYKEAINGQEAVDLFKASPQPFDIIIMDLSMPVMDGVTATREIRHYEEKQHMKRSKIIALTGQASTSARIEAMSSGADQFLTKPIKFRALKPLLDLKASEKKLDSTV